jgi:DNA replication protein DnaC
VLILDDLGLRPLAADEAADLYEVIRLRYQRGAIIITSNRDAQELGALFGDPLLASAAMDRLLHDAHVLVFEGDSYRNPPPTRKRRAPDEKKEVRANA